MTIAELWNAIATFGLKRTSSRESISRSSHRRWGCRAPTVYEWPHQLLEMLRCKSQPCPVDCRPGTRDAGWLTRAGTLEVETPTSGGFCWGRCTSVIPNGRTYRQKSEAVDYFVRTMSSAGSSWRIVCCPSSWCCCCVKLNSTNHRYHGTPSCKCQPTDYHRDSVPARHMYKVNIHCASKKFPPLHSLYQCQILTDFCNFSLLGSVRNLL